MSKICAKCSKAVYPLEELKCLDKIWHKGCFRCWECNMTLNMKNYKGYDRKPYCSAHYPQTKATVVADTPELQRLAKNTAIQSQVKYHEEFEKKIKGSKIQISDDPETQRIKQVNSVVSQVEYKGVREKTGSMESRRQSLPPTSVKKERWPSVSNSGSIDDPKSPYSDRNTSTSIVYSSEGKVEAPRQKRIGSIADYDPVNENYGSLTQGYNPVTRMSQSQEWEETIPVSPSATPMYVAKKNSVRTNSLENEVKVEERVDDNKKEKSVEDDNKDPDSEDVFHVEGGNEVAKKEDASSHEDVRHKIDQKVDELKEDFETKKDEVQNGSSASESGEHRPLEQEAIEPKDSLRNDEQLHTKSDHKIVDEHAVDHEAEPSIDERVNEDEDEAEHEAQKSESKEEQNYPSEEDKVTEGTPLKGTYAALYDYEAQDNDEVGFLEGDKFIDCESIDDGWMIGTVVRSGERGMLPANYVEQVI